MPGTPECQPHPTPCSIHMAESPIIQVPQPPPHLQHTPHATCGRFHTAAFENCPLQRSIALPAVLRRYPPGARKPFHRLTPLYFPAFPLPSCDTLLPGSHTHHNTTRVCRTAFCTGCTPDDAFLPRRICTEPRVEPAFAPSRTVRCGSYAFVQLHIALNPHRAAVIPVR